MDFFSKLFPNQISIQCTPHPGAENVNASTGNPKDATPQPLPTSPTQDVARTDNVVPLNWRESEGHQLLLTYFLGPNAIEDLPKSYDWAAVLGESTKAAVKHLIAEGALREATEAKWRILYGRGGNELKELCRSRRLKVSGTKEQLAERLAEIDSSGTQFGHNGTLYVCSEEAKRLVSVNRERLHAAMGDLRELSGYFSFAELQEERRALRQQSIEKGLNAPTDDDVKWCLLDKLALRHAKNGNFGLCANVYLAMGRFLHRRRKLEQALSFYLLVCAYDLNGAENVGVLPEDLSNEFPPFDLRTSFLAPAVIEYAQEIMESIPLSMEDVFKLFADATRGTNFPLPAERSWPVLALALDGKIDLYDQSCCFQRIRKLLMKEETSDGRVGSR